MGVRLVTSRYTVPGVYIGQLIKPRVGNLTADARVCDYVGKGSRYAVGSNLGVRRSFVYNEQLTIPTNAPFESPILYPADGVKSAPTRLYDSITGIELREDQWEFTKIGSEFRKILINPSAVDPTAQYVLDYQSISRDVLDPVPVDNLRTIKAVGNSQDRSQYKDFEDFFIPFSFSGPMADSANFIPDPFLTSIYPDAGNIGAGSLTVDPAAGYNHNYNRFYQLEVVSVGGVPGAFQATFTWLSRRYSGGNDSLPPVPLHSTGTPPSFTAVQTNPVSLVQDLELDIKVDINFDAFVNFSAGDKFYLNGVGPGLIEFDARLLNTNQYLEFSAITSILQPTSTGVVAYASNNNYTGKYNGKFALEVTATAGVFPTRSVTMIWSYYGDTIGTTGVFTYTEGGATVTLTSGVKIAPVFGANHFIVGDKFDFDAKVPRVFYQAKDDRVVNLSVATAINPGADSGTVTGSYSTGTPEGGFGTWAAEVNNLFGTNARDGYIDLPDGVSFAIRNAMRGNINGTSYAVGDIFDAAVTNLDTIDWSLTRKAEETRETAAFLTDVTGSITGTSGTVYIILDNTYTAGTVNVVEDISGLPVSFVEITGTRFVAFVTTPTVAVRINYMYRGEEPAPGQLYYFTANYLRPREMYNNPTLVLDKGDGRTLLGPAQADNHLYIMNEIAFENGAPGAYYDQIYDNDGDGIITTTDTVEALTAHEKISRATDLCLLSQFDSLSTALAVNEKMNDPFEKKEQMLWVGTPIGTPIGDVDTIGSLVFLARNTLQVTPQSPAQGTRVLLAPTMCKRNIVLENGIQQSVTLDGSFVAGASSALVNSFADPATSILRKNLTGFTYVQTYTEPENLILGQASILWMSDQGSSVYRFEEDITVHTLSEEFQLISITTQRQYVTKVVRREMDGSLISVVVPSPQAAIALIRSTLSGILIGLLGRGAIGSYQDKDGNVRAFDPDADIAVFRDTTSLTKYDFLFAWFTRNIIKRLFGLYTVNTNDFGL